MNIEERLKDNEPCKKIISMACLLNFTYTLGPNEKKKKLLDEIKNCFLKDREYYGIFSNPKVKRLLNNQDQYR